MRPRRVDQGLGEAARLREALRGARARAARAKHLEAEVQALVRKNNAWCESMHRQRKPSAQRAEQQARCRAVRTQAPQGLAALVGWREEDVEDVLQESYTG